jgi:hypothetical protein
MYGETDSCWPQATMKSDDYDNENELASMGAAQ